MRNKRKNSKREYLYDLIAIVFILFFFVLAFYLGPNVTGFAVYDISNITYEAELNNVLCEGGLEYCHSALNDSDIVLYMPFDVDNTSDAITYDFSSFNNDGILTNAPTFNSTGGHDNYGAYEFDGVNDNIVATIPNYTFSNEISFSLWINPINNTGETAIADNIINIFEASGLNTFYTDILVSKYRFITYNDSGQYKIYTVGTLPVTFGSWILITGTLNSSSTCYYTNGNLYNCYTIQDGINLSSMSSVLISNIGPNNVFNGSIDEVMIFNRSLEADEISQLYSSQYGRFYSNDLRGNQTTNETTITAGYSNVNLTIHSQNQEGTDLNCSIYDGISWKDYQNISNDVPTAFTISNTATSLNTSCIFIEDPYAFYTPILLQNITYETFNNPPTIPELNLPNNNTDFNIIPELNWNNSTDIDNDNLFYYLEVDNNLDFSSPEYVNSSITETTNPTGDTPTGLTTNRYYWHLLANDGIDNSSWSETREFLFDDTIPAEFNLLTPENSTSSTDNSPILTWETPIETNLDNYTIEISSISDFSEINFTYNTTTNSFSSWSTALTEATWYWRVTAYDKANNYKTSTDYFSYIFTGTIPPPVRSESTSMGGASKKPYTINVIAPEGITIYSNDTLIIPLIVTNPSDINLRTISLNVSSNETDVTPSLDLNYIPSLRPKEQRKINLKIITHTNPGTYGIMISTIVLQPYFIDTFRIYANLIEKDASTQNEVNKQLDFAKKLFSGNPQCLDLSEFIKQADLSLKEGKYDQALNLAKNAIDGCNKLLILKKPEQIKKLPLGLEKYLSLETLKKKTTILIASEILGLLLITIIAFKFIKKRKPHRYSKF